MFTLADGPTYKAQVAIIPVVQGVIPDPDHAEVFVQVPTINLHVANIPLRPAPDSPPYSSAQLLAAVRENPAFKNIVFRLPPSWTTDVSNSTGP